MPDVGGSGAVVDGFSLVVESVVVDEVVVLSVGVLDESDESVPDDGASVDPPETPDAAEPTEPGSARSAAASINAATKQEGGRRRRVMRVVLRSGREDVSVRVNEL